MPEGYTHLRTAQRAAQTMRMNSRFPACFGAGANGPDLFFSYEAWKRPAKRSYNLPELGRRMHEEKTGEFLLALCRNVRTGAQISFTLGFLCHYATDTLVHPYVYAVSAAGMPYGTPGGHGYFEIAVDSYLHQQDTGDAAVPASDSAPVPVGAELAEISNLLHTAILQVYGLDVPQEYLGEAIQQTHTLRSLFVSRHGIKRFFLGLIEPLFGKKGVITGHVSPRKLKEDLPTEWKNPFTGETEQGDVFALLDVAEKHCTALMSAAVQTWRHNLTWEQFAALIGNKSYTTGLEITENSTEGNTEENKETVTA